ncbi:hypothetical protein Dimus_012436 [Dionaea muscipula]
MSGNWLPPTQLTDSGRPLLAAGEVECFLLSAVDVEPEEHHSFPSLSPYKSGVLVLTNHRLIWISDSQNPAVHIPHSVITHIFTPKKSLKSIFSSPRVRFQLSLSSSGRVDPYPVDGSGSRSAGGTMVTLVMRGKADNHDLFLTKFWEAWRGRAWESQAEVSGSAPAGSEFGAGAGGGIRAPVVGVAGILRKEQEKWESTDKSLQDAFQDLNALMVLIPNF